MRQNVAGVLCRCRIDGDVTFVDVLNNSVLVDDEGGAITEALVFIIDAVILHDCAFEIAQQRKGYPVLFAEFFIGRNAIDADSENLRVVSFEFGDISLIRLHFLRSTTGECEHIERQHHILLAFKITKLVAHAAVVWTHNRAR